MNEKQIMQEKLKSIIVRDGIRSPDNSLVPPRSPDGSQMSWLLDIRRLFLSGEALDLITNLFWDSMEDRMPFQVGGLETGSLPLIGAIITKGRERGCIINGFFVRKSRKKSGLCLQVEGRLDDNPVVVVDDLINSGGSLKRVISVIKDQGRTVRDCFTVVSFGKEKTIDYLRQHDIKLICLLTIDDLGLVSKSSKPVYPERETFEVDWIFSPPDPRYVFVLPKSAPILDEDMAFYGADNGFFYAVDKRNGSLRWEFQSGESAKGITSSPVVHGQGVIFGSYDGTVYKLNRHDGQIIWRYDAADFVGSSPSLAEDLNLVYIGLEQNVFNNKGSLVALDLESGERMWEQAVREFLHATPLYIADRARVVVGTNDSNVLCFDAGTGDLQWVFEMDGVIKAGLAYDVQRNQIIASSFDWKCYAIDLESGQSRILFSANHANYCTPLVVNDRIYVGSCDKHLYVYDLATDELITRVKTQGRIMSHPVSHGDSIIFGCNDGCIREIDRGGNLTGGVYLPERTLTPVVYDKDVDRFFTVTSGNHLVCMSRKET